ncbi:MAG TPA: glycosyltransferase family 2 protein, partial [Candidatus Limnocylindrales bacterium]
MTGPGKRPRFSIVTAVYDVEPYLPDFIASIEAQRVPAADLEVVAVDDGSTDGSLDLLLDWARRSRLRVKVFTKPNGGQGSARNLGLTHATGEWVNFADPDDMLDPDFLRVAARFAAANPEVEIMAGKPISLIESVGRIADNHPRRHQYRRGNRVANLLDEPNVFSGSATVSLFRLDRVRGMDLRFDPRIRPNFEDGHFAIHYLLALDVPRVGLLRDARYLYRRRAAGTSTLQGSLAHPGRFTDVLEHGYNEVLDAATALHGSIPAWLQQVIVYELSWYLSADEKITSDIVLADELVPRFHELMARIVSRLEPDVVAAHRVRKLRVVWADILAHGYREETWHMPFVVRGKLDREMGLRRLGYRFVGAQPDERFVVDGVEVAPAFAKTRAHRYYGRVLIDERIIWIPWGTTIQVFLDGVETMTRHRWAPRFGRRGRRALAERLPIYRRLPLPFFVA